MPILVQWKREEKRKDGYIGPLIGILLLIVASFMAFVATLTGPPHGTFILLIVPAIIIFVVAIYLLKQ